MKRKLLIIVGVVAAVVLLTACGKFTCRVCGQSKSGTSYKDELLGMKITTCEDCHKKLESLEEIFDGDGDLSDIDLGDIDLGDLSDNLSDFFSEYGDEIGDVFDDLKDSLGDNLDDVGDEVKDALSGLKDSLE